MQKEHRPGPPAIHGLVHPVLMGVCATLMGLDALTPYLPRVMAIVTLFSGTFVVYFLATLTPSIDLNSSQRFSRKGSWWLLLIPTLALASLPLRSMLPEAVLNQYLGAGLIGLLYYIRVKTGLFQFNGLRSFFLVKNIALALAWSLTTATLNTVEAETIIFFIYRFTFIMALSIVIDLRDMEDDKKNGIPTIPLRAGYGISCLTACLLLIAGYLTLIFHPYQDPCGHGLATIAGMTSAIAACSVVLINFNRKKQFIRWSVDGNLLLHGLAFLVHHVRHVNG